MSLQHGHDEEKYDPNDPKEVRRIKKLIQEKLDQGWLLFGAKAGEKDMTNIKIKDIEDPELDRFIMTPMEKKLLATPLTGG